jgi:hypothetical protein
MTNKSKQIGTRGETAVVRVFHDAGGFPHAERRPLHGSNDYGDILVCPGVIVEVKWGHHAKQASLADIDKWWGETVRETKNSNAVIGLLVVQRNGIGAERAGLSRCFFDAGPLLGTDHIVVEASLLTVIDLIKKRGWGGDG